MVLEDTQTCVTSSSHVPRRSRAGCKQCRQRKRKCDERHPRCISCEDRDLPCSWQRDEPRRQPVARRHHQSNKDFTVSCEIRPLMIVFTVPSPSMQETLLAHFQSKCALWLTSGGDRNRAACLDVIMPVATRDPLVLNCVLALSAGDLSKYQPASSELTSLTQGFFGQAVAGIQSALHSEPQDSSVQTGDDVLLAIILLCVHEAVNFTGTDRILPHISAAASLCSSRCFDTAPDSRLRAFLFELFSYFFVMAAFSHGHMLHLQVALQIFESPFLSGSDYQGVLLEPQCREIFHCILRVSMIKSRITSNPGLDEDALLELIALEYRLEHCFMPQSTNDEDSTTKPADENTTTSVLYQLACLVEIKQILSTELKIPSPNIQDLVSQFITI